MFSINQEYILTGMLLEAQNHSALLYLSFTLDFLM